MEQLTQLFVLALFPSSPVTGDCGQEDTGRVLESLRAAPRCLTSQGLSFHLGGMSLLAPNIRTPSHTLHGGWRPPQPPLEPPVSPPTPSSLQCSLLKPSGHIEGHVSKNVAHCFPALLWSITKALEEGRAHGRGELGTLWCVRPVLGELATSSKDADSFREKMA